MKRYQHPNSLKWLKPPTIEQIDAVVSASGASEPRFEAFHGIYIGCIIHVRMGFRDMPLKHWHIFLSEDTTSHPNKNTNIPKDIKKPQPVRLKKDSRISTLL